MPVYNCDRYLNKAIGSVLNQTFSGFEFVIVDDGSTDKSLKIIRQHAACDERIKVISRPNTGIVGALNDGLRECRGEYVARMDGDDVSMPERFEKQVKFLQENPDIGLVGTWVLFTDSAGWPIWTYQTKESHSLIEKELMNGNGGCLVHPSIMVRRSLLCDLGGYRKCAQYVEDFDLYLRLNKTQKFANIPETLLEYRQHPGSINVTKSDHSRVNRKLRIYCELTGRNLEQKLNKESRPEEHRKWAAWASSEGYYKTALKHTLFSLILEPTKKHSWAFAKYQIQRCSSKSIYKENHT